MDIGIFEQYESEVRSYCRKFPKVFKKAKGPYIYDEDNNKYLDFFCGAGALNYGHNNDYIKSKVVQYLLDDGIVHAMDMYNVAKGEFVETYEEKILKPRGLDYKIMFTGPTGANANEAALKLARKVTGRTNVFALMGCFHGMTLGTLALTTEDGARKGAGVPMGNVTHIPAPYMFPELDTIAYMERLLTDDHSGVDKPAALVIESVQAEGGIYVLPEQWLQRARALCDKYGILMICDEVQIGNFRTGDYFSFERANIVPDIVTVAKSIGGMGMPFALTLFKKELDIWSPGEHNGTFRGFQLATVSGKAGIEFALENNISSEVKRKEKVIANLIENKILPISDKLSYRGLGMIWGIDFGKFPTGTAKKVSAACFKRNLIIELAGREDCVLKPMPALITSEEDLEKGFSIIAEATREVLGL
ncbi:MAG: aspartate aminotransferase family protein [Sphaerochaetaceae bacterium]|nr:aspartate aminotransferase family protein [Sphaerochaetaceae bacterium]